MLYYLQERITHQNYAIKHLIATDVYTWFVFEEKVFDQYFYKNKKLLAFYEDWTVQNKDTAYFYDYIAKHIIPQIQKELTFTYFDIRAYQPLLFSDVAVERKQVISLYKFFAPTHFRCYTYTQFHCHNI